MNINCSSDNTLLLVNNKVLIIHHNDKNYTCGETDEGCYVYDKLQSKLYSLPLDVYNKMLIKLASLVPIPNSPIFNPIK